MPIPGSAAGWIALSISAGIALAGCTSSDRPSLGAAGYAGAPFTHSLRFGTIAIEPAAIGERPLVPVTRARYVALHPRTWLGGAQHNDLVAFGYGRVSAPTAPVAGQPPFTNGRFAWVAVYRAQSNSLMFNGCLGGPAIRAGYHLVPGSPKPEQFYIAVLVDAITGAQATSMPLFRDVCPHLVADR